MTLADRLRRLGFQDVHAWESRVSQGTLEFLVKEMERVFLPPCFVKTTSPVSDRRPSLAFFREYGEFQYPTAEEQIAYWSPVIPPFRGR